MQVRNVITMAAGLLSATPLLAGAQASAKLLPFEKLIAECAPEVHPTTIKSVVSTESSWNPYAIGVVGGHLARQPRNLDEAVATAQALHNAGWNFSVGVAQVNRYNLPKHGLSYSQAFEPCANLRAGSKILEDCYTRASARIHDQQKALRAAFSCYYSGNFTRGFRPDKSGQPSYVQKVVANATGAAYPIPVVPGVKPESSDGAVAVRPAGRSASPTKQAATPSQWVFFTDGSQQGGQSVAPKIAASPKESDIKVQLVTPGDARSVSADHSDLVQSQRQTQDVPAQTVPTNSAQQDAPFVQFVN